MRASISPRLLLLPVGAAVELTIWLACWALALRWPSAAGAVADWAIGWLPDRDWYFGGPR